MGIKIVRKFFCHCMKHNDVIQKKYKFNWLDPFIAFVRNEIFNSILVTVFLMMFFVSPAYSAEIADFVRVGITDNNFQNVLRQSAIMYSTAECDICDKYSRRIIKHVDANTNIIIKNSYSGMQVTVGEQAFVLRDFVIVCPSGLIGIRDLKRKGQPAIYHGVFEVIHKADHTGFYLVNLVEIQEYLKGVVPNEMPVRFGLEALKAQAVAARNYVLTPRTQAYEEFNVVDSVSSQVYFGANTEMDLATQAVMETDGIVALYDNELILTLYSSTAGGYTESYSNAFSDNLTKAFPSINKPYLVAVPDKSDFVKLDTEENAKGFYMSKVPSYDIDSPYYRWSREWAVGELENVLKKTLVAQSKTGFVSPVFTEDDELGHIKDIKVMKRGISGKVMEIDVMTTRGCYRISKELVIRRVFQKDGISLPSANIVFDKTIDSEGNVSDIVVYGGGFGHGVGMSQYGAGYMANKLGQPYYNILRHYYTGVSLGTKPVDVRNEEVKQTFWAPVGRAQIVIVGQVAPKVQVVINGKSYEFMINKGLFQRETKIDISRYIEDGANVVVYKPSVCPMKMYIELVEKYETKKETASFLDNIGISDEETNERE